VIANYYMEYFEQLAISSVIRKPTHWYRYVDNTFVALPHGKEELQEFLKYLNNIHSNIKFTMETEQNWSLPFLDVLVSNRPDGSLGHKLSCEGSHRDPATS
jgi:hypothetical protein